MNSSLDQALEYFNRPVVLDVPIEKRPEGNPNLFDEDTILQELIKCDTDPLYFVYNYCMIFNNDEAGWIPFELWHRPNEYDDQFTIGKKIVDHQKLVILKARQMGLTWLVLCLFLHPALFNPTAFILLISRGETEAKELLKRAKGIYQHLPVWMQVSGEPTKNTTEWELSNGSSLRALSTRKGDSYTATHVLVDEADLVHESGTSLSKILLKVEPTIGDSGKLILLSKSDKDRPESTFKNIYKSARDGKTDFVDCFIPFYVHPKRNKKWYESQIEMSKSIDNTLDSLHENYPATPTEALAALSTSKRLSLQWLTNNYVKKAPLIEVTGFDDVFPKDEDLPDGVTIPAWVKTTIGLKIYAYPDPNYKYLITADPSEGLATSDPSPILVMETSSREDVAVLSDRLEPSVQGSIVNKLSAWYNNAESLPEVNEHGRALILWLEENTDIKIVKGWAKKQKLRKKGWKQDSVTKPLMYDTLAEALITEGCLINNETVYHELSTIERATLRAPKGLHDDHAVVYALAVAGCKLCINNDFTVDIFSMN